MTLGRCPLSICCSRGTPPNPESITFFQGFKTQVAYGSYSLEENLRPQMRQSPKSIHLEVFEVTGIVLEILQMDERFSKSDPSESHPRKKSTFKTSI